MYALCVCSATCNLSDVFCDFLWNSGPVINAKEITKQENNFTVTKSDSRHYIGPSELESNCTAMCAGVP